MFGFGLRRKSGAPEEDKGGKKSAADIDKELAKLGIFAAPEVEDDDGDLEDELLALLGDDEPSPPPRKPPPRPQAVALPQPSKPVSPIAPIKSKVPVSAALDPTPIVIHPVHPSGNEKISAPSVASVQSEQAKQSDLISDLPTDLFKAPPPAKTVLQALEQRLEKYKVEVTKANEASSASKARRMGRIVKQYEDAIIAHKKGKLVQFNELPTPPGFPPIPGQVAAPPVNLDALPGLHDTPSDSVQGEITPSVSPVRPKVVVPRVVTPVPIVHQPAQPAASEERAVPSVVPIPTEQGEPRELVSDLPTDLFKAPPPAKTVLQALEQRLEKYKSEVAKANEASSASKARRMGRIVKQYEDAIIAHKKGKPVPFDELPTPPGFPPIPGQVAAPPVNLDALPGLQDPPSSSAPGEIRPPAAISKIPSGPVVSPDKPSSGGGTGVGVRGGTKSGGKLTLQEKQLATILARQKAFKSAALTAKQIGDLDQARELLRTAKGFDKLIQASQAGLPVDMATLPSMPEAIAALESEDFEVVTASDCILANTSTADVFVKLEEDLKEQLKICMRTRDHFKSMGDIASANRFEHMALDSKRDLDTLRLAARKGDVLPSYHYETRIFSITECNSDLGEDELEVCVLKGINYKAGSPTDTFIKVELAYPSAEQAQMNRTPVVHDNEYASTYKLNINRTARNFQRFVHRHGVKLEVWSMGGFWFGLKRLIFCRRGFLRSSTLMGVATAKLLPLETKCTIHEAFDILEGRKSIGKLEVKVRIREPIISKQINQQKQKWLSIDRT